MSVLLLNEPFSSGASVECFGGKTRCMWEPYEYNSNTAEYLHLLRILLCQIRSVDSNWGNKKTDKIGITLIGTFKKCFI